MDDLDFVNDLKKKGFDYLLHFYSTLNDMERKSLIQDIKSVDFDYIKKLALSELSIDKDETIEPLKGSKKEDYDVYTISRISKIGKDIITNGEYAVVTLAGRTRNKTWT